MKTLLLDALVVVLLRVLAYINPEMIMSKINDQAYLSGEQYKDASNLNACVRRRCTCR